MKISIRRAMQDPEARRVMEKQVLATMTEIYCRGKHHTPRGQLCPQCREFLDYARARTDRCPFMATKTFCSACKVHCYSSRWRPYVKQVMGYAGPRMLLYHPVLTVLHGAVTVRKKLQKK